MNYSPTAKLQALTDQATKNALLVMGEYTNETDPAKKTQLLILYCKLTDKISELQNRRLMLETSLEFYQRIRGGVRKPTPLPAGNYRDRYTEQVRDGFRRVGEYVDKIIGYSYVNIAFTS